MAGKTASKDLNLELVRRIGATKYNPTVPDDNRYWLKHGTSFIKGVAWIHEHTFADGHPENPQDPECRRSPYCVDGQGKALFIDDFARDMGLKPQSGRNLLVEIETEGFCEIRHTERQIWRCGKIPKAYIDAPPRLDPDDPESEESDEQLCTKLPEFLREKITTSAPEFRKKALGAYRISLRWWKNSYKETLAQLRSAQEQSQNSMWSDLGLEKKRLPKRRESVGQLVKVKLLEKPNFVQSYVKSVQSRVDGLHKVESGNVQTVSAPPSLIQSRAEKTSSSSSFLNTPLTTTNSSPISPDERETDWIREAMETHCGPVDADVVRQLTSACRKAAAPETITAGEICDYIHMKGRLARKAGNPAGFLIVAVPKLITAEGLKRKRQSAPTLACPHCGNMSTEDGRCTYCHKTREEALETLSVAGGE